MKVLSVQYITVDAFMDGIMAQGRGTLLAQFDVASVYHNVAIHRVDCPLLGMKWREKYNVEMAPPFGLWLAPYIFTTIAYVVQWMQTSHHGVDFLRHCLDEFFTLPPPPPLRFVTTTCTCVFGCVPNMASPP